MPVFMGFRNIVPAPSGSELSEVGVVAEYNSEGATTTTVTCDLTGLGHTTGDFLYAIIANDGDESIDSAPATAALISTEIDNDALHSRMYRMPITGSETVLTWTLTEVIGAQQAKADFLLVRGADQATPNLATTELKHGSASDNIILGAITSLRDGSWFYHMTAYDRDNPGETLSTWPAEVDEGEKRMDEAGVAFSVGLHTALEEDADTGTTGTRTYTLTGNDSMHTIGVVIQPSESGGPSAPVEIIETDALFYFDGTATGDVTTSGNEVTDIVSQMASGPDMTTTALAAPDYLSAQINSKHATVFDGSNEHLRLDASAGQNDLFVGGGGVVQVLELASLGDTDYPRDFALSDKRYGNYFQPVDYEGNEFWYEFTCRYADSDLRVQTVNSIGVFGTPFIKEIYFNSDTPSTLPTLRFNGSAPQLTQVNPGTGAIETTAAGEVIYFGNRRADDAEAFFLNRGIDGKMAATVVFLGGIPTLVDQNTVLDELATEWGLTVADPFAPSIEAQSFFVLDTAVNDDFIGTVLATNTGDSPTYTPSGTGFTGPLAMSGADIIVDGDVGAVDDVHSGSVEVDNGAGTDSATVTVTVVATLPSGTLEWPRASNASWIASAPRFTLPATGDWDKDLGDVIATNQGDVTLQTSTDLVLIGHPSQTRVADLTRITGINRIALLGGDYTSLTAQPDQAGGKWDRLFGAFDIKTQIWIEGVKARPGYAQDFFQGDGGHGSGASEPDLFAQNCFLHELDAVPGSGHADGFQPLGFINQFNLWQVYIESGYQCLFLSNQYPTGDNKRIRHIRLRRCDLEALNLDPNIGHDTSYLISTERADDSDYTFPTEITDCWATVKDGFTPPKTVGLPEAVWSWDAGLGRLTLLGGAVGDGYFNVRNAKPARPGSEGGRILTDNGNGTFSAPGSSTVLGGIGYGL